MKIDIIKRFALLAYSISRGKLAFDAIPIFATNRCNSRCRICKIWRKMPKTDLDPKIIRKILNDKVLSRFSSFILTGGEFILHPEYEEILDLMNEHEKHYILLSNGLLAGQIIKTVRKFGVKHLSLSLDGPPKTYKEIRGVDGYSSVESVVKGLKDDDVKINIGYTVSPWNTKDDLTYVVKFCEKYGVSLSVGYYCNVEYYEATKPADKLYDVNCLIGHPYHKLYPLWASGSLNMPCLSIFLRPVVRPNGDVELCEPKEIKLGNLYEQSLGEIWRSKRTRMLQRKYISCNFCWHDAQRLCDISVISSLKSFVPCSCINHIIPKFDWKKIYQSLD